MGLGPMDDMFSSDGCPKPASALPSADAALAAAAAALQSSCAPVGPSPGQILFPRNPLPDCEALITEVLTPWPFGLFPVLPAFLDSYLHSASRDFLGVCSTTGAFPDDDIVELSVYTDGSGGSSSPSQTLPPAWAFVVFARSKDGGTRCLGCLAAPAPTIAESGRYAEPAAPSEFFAALWFLLWLLQSPYRKIPVTVHTDNMMVVESARSGVSYRTCDTLPYLLENLVK